MRKSKHMEPWSLDFTDQLHPPSAVWSWATDLILVNASSLYERMERIVTKVNVRIKGGKKQTNKYIYIYIYSAYVKCLHITSNQLLVLIFHQCCSVGGLKKGINQSRSTEGHPDPQSVLTSADLTALAGNVHGEGVWRAVEWGTGHPSAFHSPALRKERKEKASQQRWPQQDKAHIPSQKLHQENRRSVRSSWGCPGDSGAKEPSWQSKRPKRCGLCPCREDPGGRHGNPLYK